jgi:aminoglycoside 2'-N-acetyltransferase I
VVDADARRVAEFKLQIAHTAELDAATLRAVRGLLEEVFGAGMTEHDWDHALGGVHALAWDEGELVGHASVVQRRLVHAGRALRTGYFEGVAVRSDRRRRGYGTAIMDALERVVRSAYELGALGASAEGARFYAKRSWQRWQGQTWALTPTGRIRTAGEDGDVFVLQVAVTLDLSGELTCDWREGGLW